MRIQDISCAHASIAFLGQHHNHESACSYVFNMVPQVFVLLRGAGEAKQRALELSEKSVFLPGRIETIDVLVAVEDVDLLSFESCLKQRADGRVGGLRIV